MYKAKKEKGDEMALEDKYSESSISLLIDFLFEFLTVKPQEAVESKRVCTQIIKNLNEIIDEVLESLDISEKKQKQKEKIEVANEKQKDAL